MGRLLPGREARRQLLRSRAAPLLLPLVARRPRRRPQRRRGLLPARIQGLQAEEQEAAGQGQPGQGVQEAPDQGREEGGSGQQSRGQRWRVGREQAAADLRGGAGGAAEGHRGEEGGAAAAGGGGGGRAGALFNRHYRESPKSLLLAC